MKHTTGHTSLQGEGVAWWQLLTKSIEAAWSRQNQWPQIRMNLQI